MAVAHSGKRRGPLGLGPTQNSVAGYLWANQRPAPSPPPPRILSADDTIAMIQDVPNILVKLSGVQQISLPIGHEAVVGDVVCGGVEHRRPLDSII